MAYAHDHNYIERYAILGSLEHGVKEASALHARASTELQRAQTLVDEAELERLERVRRGDGPDAVAAVQHVLEHRTSVRDDWTRKVAAATQFVGEYRSLRLEMERQVDAIDLERLGRA